jgi:hypothetical protein
MSSLGSSKAEPAIAFAVAILGMAVTTWGAFTHAAPLLAPGASLILLGGAWFGNALARLDVRIFPTGEHRREGGGG